MMKFLITDDIFEQYPDTQIGVIVARGLDNSGESAELLVYAANQRLASGK